MADSRTSGSQILDGIGTRVGAWFWRVRFHGWFDIPDHVDYLSFRPSHGIMKNGWINPTIAPK